jgi:hypothetical protein
MTNYSGAGFSLSVFVSPEPKTHRLKSAPQKANP